MTEVDGGVGASALAWPPGPDALVDTTRCPACFTAIIASPCVSCGLDLTDARTARVLDLSQRIVDLVDERAEVLRLVFRAAEAPAVEAPTPERRPATPAPDDRSPSQTRASGLADPPELRNDPRRGPATGAAGSAPSVPAPSVPAVPGSASVAAASAPDEVADVVFSPPSGPALPPRPPVPAAAAPAASAPSPGPAALPTPAAAGALGAPGSPPSPDDGSAFPPPSPAVALEPSKPRRSSVQVFLLSVGVVLLAVAAAFFLTVAWISGGLVLRSIIIGLVTAAIVATASLLRRRGLGATSEGIALLAIAFVALDVWAVRANDLAGAASIEPRVYGGTAMIVAGIAFVGWARLSRLRAPLSTAVISLALGPAVLVTGVVTRDAALGWYAWGLALLLVALAAPLAPLLARRPRPALSIEIAVIRGLGALGTTVALAAASLVDPQSTATPTLLSAVLAVVLAAHAWALARGGAARLAPTAAVLAVLVLGVGVAATVARAADATVTMTVPVLISSALALGLDVAARRVRPGVGRTTTVVASLAAAIGAGLAAVFPLVGAVTALGMPLRRASEVFGRSSLAVDVPDAASTASVLTLAGIVVVAAIVWRLAGSWAQRRTPVLIAAAGVALLAGPQVRVLVGEVTWYLALAVIAIVVLRRRQRDLDPRRRRSDIVLAAVGGPLALGTGWLLSFSSPLAWALATAVVAAILWAAADVHAGLRVPSTVSVVLFLTASALLAPTALDAGVGIVVDGATALTVSLAVATLSLVFVVAPFARRLGVDDAQRGAGVVAALAAIVVVGLPAPLFGTGTAPDVWVLVSALVAASAAAVVLTPSYRSWGVARPVAAVLTPLLVGGAAGSALRVLDAPPLAATIMTATIALVTAALALGLLRDDATTRALLDVGAAVMAVLSITGATSQGVRWLPLLIAAVTAVLWATGPDGLFRSRGRRRHFVWLALVLGALALWTRLFWQQTESVEAFTVPVGAAVLVIAVGYERARRVVAERSVAVPAVVAAAGFTLALAPSALSAPDDAVRTLAVAAVSVAVLTVGAWVRPTRTPDEIPVAIAVAGGLSLLLLTVTQLGHAAGRGGLGPADALVAVSAAAIGAAAVGVSRRSPSWAAASARHAAVVAVAILALGSTTLVAADGGPISRMVTALVVLGGLGVVALRVDRALLGMPLAITAHGGAGVLALAGVVAGVRPIEWATVPLALAWIAAAVLDRRRPVALVAVLFAAGGVAVGLLPSALLAADAEPVRAIAVTVGAIAVLVAAVLHLRQALAPLLAPVVIVASLGLESAASLRGLREVAAPVFDLWMLAAAVPLVAVAVVLRRREGVPPWLPTALVLAASVTVVGLTATRLSATGEGALRLAVTLVAILAVGLWWRGSIVLWAVVSLSGVLVLTAFAFGSADPVEAGTAPLAVALLVHGIRSLRRQPDLRTWPALGIGLGLLLLPSLLFDITGGNALWRVIALGVVALVVLLAGVRVRWQAPVLLGGVVLIVHAIAQLWPWITALYASASGLWWLWLGIAGVLLIVIAATYERRIREVRAVALAIRSLR